LGGKVQDGRSPANRGTQNKNAPAKHHRVFQVTGAWESPKTVSGERTGAEKNGIVLGKTQREWVRGIGPTFFSKKKKKDGPESQKRMEQTRNQKGKAQRRERGKTSWVSVKNGPGYSLVRRKGKKSRRLSGGRRGARGGRDWGECPVSSVRREEKPKPHIEWGQKRGRLTANGEGKHTGEGQKVWVTS